MVIESGAHATEISEDVRNWHVSVLLSLLVSFAATEIVGINHVVRTLVQGYAFWVYISSVFGLIALTSGGLVFLVPRADWISTWKLVAYGVCGGFICGLLSILLNAPFVGKGFGPSWRALKEPTQLALAAVLGMGWLYGGISAFATRVVMRGRYLTILYFLLACAGVRVLEVVLAILTK